jgi:TonB family protein
MTFKLNSLFFLIPVVLLLLSSCKEEKQAPASDSNVMAQEKSLEEDQARDQDTTYAQVPHMPRFPGCEDIEHPLEKTLCAKNRLNNYIHNRLRYPRAALNNQIEGTVVAEFVVRPDGLIDDIGVHNDLGFGTGETVLKIIKSMNFMNERWIPGRKDGKAVRVRLALPIEFRLMDYQKEEGYQPGK